MARQSTRAEINTFVQGLITEASSLNFPPNASKEEENFELNRDGSRERRLGMDFEESYFLRPTDVPIGDIDNVGVNTFKWTEVSGISDKEFCAVQLNRTIYFLDLNRESLSGSGYVGQIELTQYPLNTSYSFAAIEGRLVVTAGVDTIAIIEAVFSGTTTSFLVNYDRIKTRDLWGIQEIDEPRYENDPSFRGVLTDEHRYNLQNQSWGIPRRFSDGIADPIAIYVDGLGKAPSNTEQVWTGMQFQPVQPSQDPFERLYPNLYEESLGATTNTAKGYYIIDALRRGESRFQQVLTNTAKYPQMSNNVKVRTDLTPGGAKYVTEFAGRAFYAGFSGEVIEGDNRSPNLANHVFFSQLVKNKSDLVKCYQEGDPTSRENSDIVATDGGFLPISGAKKIIGLLNLETHLVVIASNGVWAITGGSDYGFTADNYKASKISSFGGFAESSIVVEGENAFFWAEDGIYRIGKNQFGDLEVTSMTLSTIQKLYESIPNEAKQNVKGIYDLLSKKIRWIYKTGQRFTSESETKELVFDTLLGAFTINSIKNLNPNNTEVFSLFQGSAFKTGLTNEAILVDVEEVFSGADQVIVSTNVRTSGIQSVRFLVLTYNEGVVKFTVAQYKEQSFHDWKAVDGVGVDAKAFCLTGDATAGDSSVDKQVPYLVMHFIRTEEGVDSNLVPLKQSGCLFRMQWAFSNTIASNKWTPLRQAYRYRRVLWAEDSSDPYDTGFSVITSKNKVRGSGPSFALYFETEEGKDCRLLGWNLTIAGNSLT